MMRFDPSTSVKNFYKTHYKLNDHIYIGIRPKYLAGYMNINVSDLSFKLYTDPDDYSLKLNYNGELRF